MSLGIKENLKKYVELDDNMTAIDKFKCPIEGCSFTTKLGPGALRMHILLKADPKIDNRYCEKHEDFLKENIDELSLETVRYFGDFPINRMQAT